MRIRISHDTTYTYSEPVNAAMQLLRLTPRGHDGQRVISWSIDTDCNARLIRREDWYGNIMHSLYAAGPIDHIGLKVVGEIVTTDVDGIIRGGPERFPEIFYLRATALTQLDPAIREFAEASVGHFAIATREGARADGRDSANACVSIPMRRPQRPRPSEAFAAGHGVCQDFTHIFLAAARHAGMPARYVSGYLHKAGARPRKRRAMPGPKSMWRISAGSASTRPMAFARPSTTSDLATGLDYLDAAPVRGSYYGVSREALDVSLRIEGAGQSQRSDDDASQRQQLSRRSPGATPMTYCVGILVREGLVMIADTRTNAGVDNIALFASCTCLRDPGRAHDHAGDGR